MNGRVGLPWTRTGSGGSGGDTLETGFVVPYVTGAGRRRSPLVRGIWSVVVVWMAAVGASSNGEITGNTNPAWRASFW